MFDWFKPRNPKRYMLDIETYNYTRYPTPSGATGIQGTQGTMGAMGPMGVMTEKQVIDLMKQHLKPESFKQ